MLEDPQPKQCFVCAKFVHNSDKARYSLLVFTQLFRTRNKGLNVSAGLVQPHLVFGFRDTNRDSLVFLRSETRAVATRVSERKRVQSTELDMVNGSFCNLCALALWLALHIFATQC